MITTTDVVLWSLLLKIMDQVIISNSLILIITTKVSFINLRAFTAVNFYHYL